MLQNIILIILIIFMLFFISNDEKLNKLINKKYIPYLFILLIVYFIYQQYNFILLVIVLMVIIFLNVNLKKKIRKIMNDVKEKFDNFTEEDVKEKDPENETEKVEPFKNEVNKLKELYENIKLEITKLS